ncbi:hypothetical protein Poli38472_011935 [Pythium oligandrum]|uniref:Uncharacterized protein n=1 Tax=Pythium oligandrum TaxID=41045 RepID=A0A8K1CNN8_PYTOL|nr:hypothetical protein Poli38472_011935 [Pythium oligandrum]|eukprot:TMW66819.1 hypothetical protein Poli38472_011935 [Pythium oligandrum]
MVCLPVGGGILFDLSTPGSYPIYQKDSMLNTNPNFDYGAFRSLAARVRANTSFVSAFAFSFTEPGTYVFGNSLNSAAKTVITVMKEGTTCPVEAPIVPLSEKNLIAVSAKRRTDDLILAPDWALIIGLLGGLIGMVVAVIVGLYYFRTKSWTTSGFRNRLTGYRAMSKQTDLSTVHSKGSLLANKVASPTAGAPREEKLTPAPVMMLDEAQDHGTALSSPRWTKPNNGARGEYQPDLGRWDEEDVDLRELVDRLQFHHEAVTKCFDDQKDDVQKLLQHLQLEAAELKRLFVNAVASTVPHHSNEIHRLEISGDSINHNPEETATDMADLPLDKGEHVVLETLRTDLADRRRFRSRRETGFERIAKLLGVIEGWGRNNGDLPRSLVDDMAMATKQDEPESTTPNEERVNTYLEHVHSVLGDLKTLLSSDPLTVTSSSVVQLADSEKIRREIGEMVLDAAQRQIQCSKPSDGSDGTSSSMLEILSHHENVARAENKEDELMREELQPLQKFGVALPKLIGALETMETNFQNELAQLREEQNPSKEVTSRLQMEERINQFVKELAKSAGRIQDRRQKGRQKLTKAKQSAVQGEEELERSLLAASEHHAARLEQRAEARRQALASKKAEADSVLPTATSGPTLNDDTLSQIKELLVRLAQHPNASGLSTFLPAQGQVESSPLDSLLAPVASDVVRLLPVQWKQEPTIFQSLATEELASLRKTAEEEAQVLLERQEAMQHEYQQMLQTQFPGLSPEDKAKLLRDFGMDLTHLESAVKMEAHKTETDIQNLLTARAVLNEKQKENVARLDEQQKQALADDQRHQERQLESQFTDEEQAIESEYQQELARLAQEFGVLEESDMMELPLETEEIESEGDEWIYDDAGDAMLPTDTIEEEDESDEQILSDSVEDVRFRTSRPRGSTDMFTLREAMEKELSSNIDEIRNIYTAYQQEQFRAVDSEAAQQQERLRQRLARRREQLGLLQAPKDLSDQDQELEHEQAMSLEAIAADIAARKLSIDQQFDLQMTHLPGILNALTNSHSDEIEALLAECCAKHAAGRKKLVDNMKQERQTQEQSLEARLSKRREQQKLAIAAGVPISDAELLESDHQERVTLENELEATERREIALLMEKRDADLRRVSDSVVAKLMKQSATAKQEKKDLELALQRVLEDHHLARSQLQMKLEAEGKAERTRLQQRLAKRREESKALSAASDPVRAAEAKRVLDEEAYSEEVALETKLACAAKDSSQAKRDQQAALELELANSISEAACRIAASDAACVATREAIERETKKLWEEFDGARLRDTNDEADAASLRRQRIRDRLNAKQTGPSGPVDRVEGGWSDPTKTLSAVESTLSKAVNDEIAGIRKCFDESLKHRQKLLEQESAMRKKQLEQRLYRKRRNTDNPAADAELVNEEAAELAAIDDHMAHQLVSMGQDIREQQSQLELTMKQTIADKARDVEDLLEACRQDYATQHGDLVRRMAQERVLREEMLRERLRLRQLQQQAEDESATQGEIPGIDERDKMERELQAELRVTEEKLCSEQLAAVRQIISDSSESCRERLPAKKAEVETIEEELQRIRNEHEREYDALQSALNAERSQKELRLKEKLEARRNMRLRQLDATKDPHQHAQVLQKLQKEEDMQLMQLSEQLTQKETHALAQKLAEAVTREKECESRLLQAVVDTGASVATGRVFQTMEEEELARIRRNFERGQQERVNVDQLDAATHRSRLSDRLSDKKARRGPETSTMAVSNESVLKPAGSEQSEMADALDAAIETELQRVRDSHAVSMMAHQLQLRQEAELQKALLRERMARKRAAALSVAVSNSREEAGYDSEVICTIAVEQAQALTQIDQHVTDELTRLQAFSTAQASHTRNHTKSAAVQNAEEIDRLIESCRASHAKEALALRERLKQERDRQEMALRDRLSKRRATRLGDTTPADPTTMEKLLKEEQQDLGDLDTHLRKQEASAQQEMQLRHGREVSACTQEAERIMAQREEDAKNDEEAVMRELVRLREDHQRAQNELEAEIEAYRNQQAERLQASLARRQAEKERRLDKAGTNDEIIAIKAVADAEDEMEKLKVDEDVLRYTEETRGAMRSRHLEEEHKLLLRQNEASAKAIAAAAARKATEVAREAELKRIAVEYNAGRADNQADEDSEAVRRKQRLQDRVAAKKTNKQKMVIEQSSVADSDLVKEDTPSAAAAETIDHAMEDAIERLRRQHASNMQQRISDLEAEKELRKSQLRARMEQRRQALRLKAGAEMSEAAVMVEEQALEAQEQQELVAIERDCELMKRQLDEETSRSQAQLLEQAGNASRQHAEEIERLLAACRATHDEQMDALQNSLALERARREKALQDRLSKKRAQRQVELDANGAGLTPDAVTIAQATLEEELLSEEEQARKDLLREISDKEAMELKQAQAQQQRELENLSLQEKERIDANQAKATLTKEAAERELLRVKDEHERERLTLEKSIAGERKRQELKLQEKLAKRRAQRQQEIAMLGDSDAAAQMQNALEAEERLERLKLEEEMDKKASRALVEELFRQQEQERALELQVHQASLDSAAADAARQALEVARKAEADRITREFESTRRDALTESDAEATTQHSKLEQRLAEKRRAKNRRSVVSAGKKVRVITRLSSIAERQAQQEIERLQNEHSEAWQERCAGLEAEAALRKARLAERIAKRRAELAATPTSVDNQQAQESVLQQEEEAELQAINQQLEMDKKLMLDEITRNQEQVTAALHEAAKRNAEEMEKLLTDCKETHAQESKQLAESLELERQRQERALQERIARRKNQRASKQEQQQTTTHSPESQDESLEVRPSSADEELKAERERRELRAQLDAKEQQAWEEMRRKQEEELNELTKQAEAIALKKQEDAKLLQESTQAELDRLKQEHEAEMNALTASLEVEQKRQQQQLQQRIAQRRQQKQNESQQQVLAKEQLAKQLEEQERLERIAMEELEAKFQAEVARKVEEERERQRNEEAEVAARLAQASIDAAAADAARKAMDAAREIEIERLASEFEEKSRELRQSHMADLLAQKQKLEARVAAKKQKKLMELEAKKEIERLKLQQKQHEEQERMQAEQAQVQNALEAAVAMASGDGDASLPPDSQVEIPPDEVRTATPAPHVEASDELARQSQEEAEAAEVAKTIQQQEKDIAAIQQLFQTRIIPHRMTLINAIDYILSGRHQKETSLLFATQYKAKTVAVREALRDIMQQKATQKAMLIKNMTSPSEQENQVKELDDAYDAKIREVEQRTLKDMELQRQTEAKRLKDHQLAQVEFLLKYFNTLYVAAVSRAQQEADEEAQRLVQVAKLRAFESDEDVDRGRRQLGRLRRRNVGDNDDTEDLIDELRARLQVEADERILQLYKERESDLRRLSEGAEAVMQQISDEFDRLVEAERVNIEHAHSVRLSELPSSATSACRDVLVREKEAQFHSLVLMLRGRRSQREAIEKQAVTKQVRAIEDDCERRVRVVEAKMMERLVEEKEMLRKKLALAKTEEATEATTVAKDDEEEAGAEEDTPSVIDRPSSPLILESGRKKVESAVRRATLLRSIVNESETDNDLRQMLESRLQTIESLLQEKVSSSLDSKKTQLDEKTDDSEAYKLSIRLATQEACGWARDLEVEHCVGEGTMILEAKQQRLDFANALLHTFAPTNGELSTSSSIRRVMLSTALLPSLKQLDASSQTLFLHSSCLEKLTAGQIAVLVLHAVVEAQTQTSDVADPEFIACLHRLLQSCYQNLYDKSSQTNGKADKLASNNHSKVVQSASPRSAHPRRSGGDWQSHLFQVESFLAGIDHTLRPDISDGAVTPRTGSVRRQPTVMLTGLGMACNSSRFSLKDSETTNEMEALVLQERRQFLLDKLDSAEKLYTQVLRQHQEQKESLEYIQEMLVEEQEQEPEGKQTREEKAAHVKQMKELHHEVEAMETSLDKTRQERDELFRQCQSLRDELASLPRSRPPTATGVGSVPVIAEAKTDG